MDNESLGRSTICSGNKMEGVNEKENKMEEEEDSEKHAEEDSENHGPLELGKWIQIQESLKKRVITADDFSWEWACMRYVGGVDVSFCKESGSDPSNSMACGSLVVLDLHNDLGLVYQDHHFTSLSLHVPYVPAFLAFRELPILVHLLENMKSNASPFYPQILMVDGNGILHPRAFGLASHLGVLADLPTIGIGKNLHHVDGLTRSGIKELFEAEENRAKDIITLRGSSGFIWGAAMRSTQGSLKPIFVSIGHRVSLDTAIKIVKMTSKFRVPEPIRQADIRSREHLRKHQIGMFK